MHEPAYYNSCAQFCNGNYSQLSKLKKGHETWESVYLANKNLLQDPEMLFDKLWKAKISVLLSCDEAFPRQLLEIPNPPFGFYYQGTLPEFSTPLVGIVGTRKASPVGVEAAKSFSKKLATNGVGIVSGLALGVDSAAHEGALLADGLTIAVLPGGLGSLYPSRNKKLAKKIIESGGALLSEFPPDFRPQKYSFLERNRIVSGLSLGILVVESPARSGTLSTAGHAVDQNRDVFVIPGPLTNPNYAGSHDLIRAGAELVTSSLHILESLNISPSSTPRSLFEDASIEHTEVKKRIVELLRAAPEPLHPDSIAKTLKLDNSVLYSELSDLVVDNYIKEEGGYYFIV